MRLGCACMVSELVGRPESRHCEHPKAATVSTKVQAFWTGFMARRKPQISVASRGAPKRTLFGRGDRKARKAGSTPPETAAGNETNPLERLGRVPILNARQKLFAGTIQPIAGAGYMGEQQ